MAFSGGRDSTALLHATLQAAERLGIRVVALHVHHGLSPNAGAWVEHCAALCERWAQDGRPLTFAVHCIDTAPGRGESVEAWARKARYAALRALALAHGTSLVLLAHHRRDQAETLLLQALRGSGVAGLAGMPGVVLRSGITWARPWLYRSHAAIDGYLRLHRLPHIEDESNRDERYARNRLRLRIWPSMLQAFPQAEATLADAAAWAFEATRCIAELAAIDLALVDRDGAFSLEPWLALSLIRRSNVLRAWLRRETGVPATASLICRLLQELSVCRSARWPLAAGELLCHRGMLTFAKSSGAPRDAMLPTEVSLQVLRAGTYRLPGWGGALKASRVREGGIDVAALGHLDLLQRTGGENFQAGAGRPARSLKKQYQAAAVPAWRRGGPLVYSAGRLLFVPGLGVDARVLARPGDPQMTLEWIDGAPTR